MPVADEPLRDELLSIERLEERAKALAALGDRDDGEVIVGRERVVVGPSRYRDAPVVLSLRPLGGRVE